MVELAETMNPNEIAEEMGCCNTTVRHRLDLLGVPMLRWCRRCEANRPVGEFKVGNNQFCRRHCHLKPKKYIADKEQVEADQFAREARKLERHWMATLDEFRNPWVASYGE